MEINGRMQHCAKLRTFHFLPRLLGASVHWTVGCALDLREDLHVKDSSDKLNQVCALEREKEKNNKGEKREHIICYKAKYFCL